MQALQINLIPIRKALIANNANELFVLANVSLNKELAAQKFDRPKLKIAYVLDRSGSMSGQRIDEAKKCIRQSINLLDAKDQMTLVSYDDEVSLDMKLDTVENQLTQIDNVLSGINSGGSTNLSGGWSTGADVLVNDKEETACLKRVFLLSDGHANQGVCSLTELGKIGKSYWDKEVSTSTFGIGTGFNEELMSEIAKQSGGSTFFGETSNDLSDPFGRDINELAQTFAYRVKLSVQTRNAKIKVKQMNDFNEGLDGVDLQPLTIGAKSWVLLKCSIPASEVDVQEDLFKVIVKGIQVSNGNALVAEADFNILPAVDLSVYQALGADEEVSNALSEVQLIEQRKVLQAAIDRGNWEQVEELIQQLKNEKDQSEWKKKLIVEMEVLSKRRDAEMLKKEAYYSSKMMSSSRKADMQFMHMQSDLGQGSIDQLMAEKRYLYQKSSSRKNN
jgi:Ca-activated chloride channel family protein